MPIHSASTSGCSDMVYEIKGNKQKPNTTVQVWEANELVYQRVHCMQLEFDFTLSITSFNPRPLHKS